jgi:hypothetical protein
MSKTLRGSILAILLVAAAAPLPAATPLARKAPRETVTVAFLLEACSVVGETAHGMIPHFDCESYLYGVLDAQSALAANSGGASTCVPETIAPWQVYEALLAAPIPDARRGEPAAPFVLEVVAARFACP